MQAGIARSVSVRPRVRDVPEVEADAYRRQIALTHLRCDEALNPIGNRFNCLCFNPFRF